VLRSRLVFTLDCLAAAAFWSFMPPDLPAVLPFSLLAFRGCRLCFRVHARAQPRCHNGIIPFDPAASSGGLSCVALCDAPCAASSSACQCPSPFAARLILFFSAPSWSQPLLCCQLWTIPFLARQALTCVYYVYYPPPPHPLGVFHQDFDPRLNLKIVNLRMSLSDLDLDASKHNPMAFRVRYGRYGLCSMLLLLFHLVPPCFFN
jgi:hypothetical protein